MDTIDLTGKIVIAMPGIMDPRFDRSVIFICDHGEDGAMGLIVNRTVPKLDFADLMQQLEIELDEPTPRPIHFGGPVEPQRGFVLHTGDYDSDATSLEIDGTFAMTATLDVLRDIATGGGPARALVALGYAGWKPRQLEGEIAGNDWLIADATPDMVFDENNDGKWVAALGSLGINPLLLSADGGRA